MNNNSCTRLEADAKQISRCKESLSTLQVSFDFLSQGLELVSNNVRLKILYLICVEKQLCVCDLSDILEMTVPAISQHLRKLRDRGFIESKREGQIIFNSLTGKYETLLTTLFGIIDKSKIPQTI